MGVVEVQTRVLLQELADKGGFVGRHFVENDINLLPRRAPHHDVEAGARCLGSRYDYTHSKLHCLHAALAIESRESLAESATNVARHAVPYGCATASSCLHSPRGSVVTGGCDNRTGGVHDVDRRCLNCEN